jgi:hypothetical protein
MIIPWQQLNEETLQAILEEFVLREGTDYGETELPLEQKIDSLKQQLIAQEVVIVYSELYENVSIMPASEFKS